MTTIQTATPLLETIMDGSLLVLIGCGFLFFLLIVTIIWDFDSRRIEQQLREFINKFTQKL